MVIFENLAGVPQGGSTEIVLEVRVVCELVWDRYIIKIGRKLFFRLNYKLVLTPRSLTIRFNTVPNPFYLFFTIGFFTPFKLYSDRLITVARPRCLSYDYRTIRVHNAYNSITLSYRVTHELYLYV